MTKSDLVDKLCEMQKLPKGRAELLVNCIFEAMEESLKRGERIEIRGFGSFEIRSYKAYEGRNPRTGSTVDVRPKRLPFFKVGKELKERVNNGGQTNGASGNGVAASNGSNGHSHNGISNGSNGHSHADSLGLPRAGAAPKPAVPGQAEAVPAPLANVGGSSGDRS